MLKDSTFASKTSSFCLFLLLCRFEYLREYHFSFMLQTLQPLIEDLKEADPGSAHMELARAYLLGLPVMFT
ncbi:hypothetical protein ACQP3C_29160, partial [Escherichia coli]